MELENNSTSNSAENKPALFQKNPPFHFLTKQKILFIVIIILLVFFVITLKYVTGLPADSPSQSSSTSQSQEPQPLVVKEIYIQDVLINHVPNFEKLEIRDLPRITPRDKVYLYNDKFLIVGSRIIEVDPETKKILRQNDTFKFNCVWSSTLIKDTLYLYCPQLKTIDPVYVNKRGIYALDLKSNSIKKAYFDQFTSQNENISLEEQFEKTRTQDKLPIFINVHLGNTGGMLWVGTRNGVVRINPNNDDMKFYHASVLGQKNQYTCPDVALNSNKNLVWTWARQACGPLSVYDFEEEKWISFQGTEVFNTPAIMSNSHIAYNNQDLYVFQRIPSQNKIEIAKYSSESSTWMLEEKFFSQLPEEHPYLSFLPNTVLNSYNAYADDDLQLTYFDENDILQKFDLELDFIGISNIINDNYYLIASDGVYLLTSDTFPQKLFSYNFPHKNAHDTRMSKVFVDDSEEKMLFIGIEFGMNDNVTFYLINLKDKSVKEIKQRLGDDPSETPQNIRGLLHDVVNSTSHQTDTGVRFLKDSSDEVLLEVNLISGEVKFTDSNE